MCSNQVFNRKELTTIAVSRVYYNIKLHVTGILTVFSTRNEVARA